MRRVTDMAGRRRIAIGVATLASALVLLAAGIASAGSLGGASASEAHAKVTIKEFEFKPFKLTVPRGAEVTFANRDSTTHEPSKQGTFDTGRIKPGHSESVRFNKRGTYNYICSIHPFMHGKIVVN
jgi:plastocyanin